MVITRVNDAARDRVRVARSKADFGLSAIEPLADQTHPLPLGDLMAARILTRRFDSLHPIASPICQLPLGSAK